MGASTHLRARSALLLAFAVLAFRFVGCSDDFYDQSNIISLRVLGVQANPAELIIQDGGPLPYTTFTALAIEPSGAPITTVFSLCDQQGVLPAANLDCPGDGGLQLPDAGPDSATLDLNSPAVQALALSLLTSLDGGAAAAQSQLASGIPLVIGFSADAPAYGNPDGGPPPTAGYSDQHLIGFTDINLRSADPSNPINHNPQLAAVTANQQPLDPAGSSQFHVNAQLTLTPVPENGAKEPLPDGGVESLDYSFYTTNGSISDLRSTDTTATGQPGIITTTYTAPSAPGPVRLWVVVRDGRGGIGWVERDFSIIP